MQIIPSPRQNHLLESLPESDFIRIQPILELVSMPLGQVIYESGEPQGYVYFPSSALVSLLYVLGNGSTAEIAIVGNEGALGVSLYMGGETTTHQAIVQIAGYGYRMKANQLKQEFNRAGPLMNMLLLYTQALLTQMAQTAVCNRHHTIDQQLCRWLLFSLDRLKSNDIFMTQELIANMLGVRRGSVTDAAGKLQNAGLINYSRGHIRVLDRLMLEKTVCECYLVVKNEFDRLLPDMQRNHAA
jgi:CRP-like cAMP-binding protein